MRKRKLLSKFLALFVTATVALSNPALALRPKALVCLATGISFGLSPPAFALRELQPIQNSGLRRKIANAIGHPAPAASGMEELQERLTQLAHLQGTTGREFRRALWNIRSDPDPHQPHWTRETLLKAIQQNQQIIQATGITTIQSPWGNVDLNQLNSLNQYPAETAAYLIARDIEISVVLGLLSVQRVGPSTGVRPSAVYKVLKNQIGPAASISWTDALLLRQQAQTLSSSGSLTIGAITFSFQTGQQGQPPTFSINGQTLEPDEAQMRFYDALRLSDSKSMFYALPRSIREAFHWKWRPAAAGLEESGGSLAITIERMTATQLRTKYGLDQTALPSNAAFVVATAQVASQIRFYYMHDTVEPGLAHLMAEQRNILPKGVELALVAAPASPDQLRRPGGLFIDRWLPKKYDQSILPEIPVTLGEPLPSLPSLILWILRGAGGEILEVKGVLKLEDNVFAYFV